MNLSDLFTLVVPVRERHYNIPALVEYYKNTSYRKIIYDASIKPYEGYLGNFEYHHVGPEFQTISYLNLHKMVKTPFLINCPDDDLMTHMSISECVSFLKNNEKYSACDGSVIEWNPNDGAITPQPKPMVFKARALRDWDIGDIFERLEFATVMCSRSCLHSFVRTDQSVDILENFIKNKDISPLSFLDRVYTFSTHCHGPVKTLALPNHIRTANSRANADRVMFDTDIANELIDGYGLRLDINMINSIDKKHCSKFSHFLSQNANINHEEATEFTIDLFKKHFKFRRSNGGGGYFGPSLDANFPMPAYDPEFSWEISTAVNTMRKCYDNIGK